MKNRVVVLGLLGLVLLVIVGALWMIGAPSLEGPDHGGAPDTADATAETTHESAGADASEARAESGPDARRRRGRKWVHTGDGTLVGTLREYGTDQPVVGVRVTLVAGKDGPDRELAAIADEQGGFVFHDVPAFDAWTLVAHAPAPLSAAEVGGVAVDADQQSDLGVVYLAPGFLVEGLVVDPKGVPIQGALVRAIRGKSGPANFDILGMVRDIPKRLVAVDEATTGAKGAFALSKVAPGTYDMYVSAPGRQLRVSRGILVTPDRQGGALRFVLRLGFELSGRVIRENGGGPAGLTVVAFPEPQGIAGFQTLTEKVFADCDDEGLFTLDGLRAGDYMLTVTPENAPTTMINDVKVPGSDDVELRVADGASLDGRVRDSEGAAIEGAQVMLILDGGGDAPVFASTRTDAEGRYRLESLPVLKVQGFLVRCEGYAPYPSDPSAMFMNRGSEQLEIVAGHNQRDVELIAGGSVRGKVVNEADGKGIGGVRVSLVSQMAIFGGANTATTQEDGSFELVGVPKGQALLALWKEGWNQGLDPMKAMQSMGMRGRGGDAEPDSGEGPAISITEPGQVVERTLRLSRGIELTGQVLSPKGAPVAGAKVEFGQPEGARDMLALMGMLSGSTEPRLTDSGGRFTLPGALVGKPNIVQVTAAGYRVTRSDPITVTPGEDPAPIAITLGVGATIRGTIVGKDGAPVAGVEITYRLEAAGRSVGTGQFSGREPTYSATDGAYVIENVGPGKHVMNFQHASFVDHEEKGVSVADGDERELDITLDPGLAVTGVVLGPDERPFVGARVRLQAPDRGIWERTNTDTEGRFEFRGLAKGGYTLTASAEGVAPSDGDTAVEAGGDEVVLRLIKAYAISGTVVFAGGRPAANALVVASGAERNRGASTRVESDGTFRLEALPAGDYALEVRTGWGQPSERPNLVQKTVDGVAAGTTGLAIEVEEGLVVTGTVTLLGGKPAPNGWVNGNAIDADGRRDQTRSGNLRGTIAEGRMHVDGLEAGRYRLNVRVGAQQRTIDVDAGETDLRVEFGETGDLSGRVTRSDGGSVENGTVNVYGPDGSGWARVGKDGSFTITGLSVGRYTARASLEADGKKWQAERQDVDVVAGGMTAGTDLSLEPEE